jgi:hypothetical protein
MDITQIAQELYDIYWTRVQTDDPQESFQVTSLLHEIEQLPHSEGLRLILHVLQVKSLMLENGQEDHPFVDMKHMRFMGHYIKSFPTDELR